MPTIHTVRQTVTCYPVINFIPSLSHHFDHCGFPSKINLQPLVGIIFERALGPSHIITGDCMKTRLLRRVIGSSPTGLFVCRKTIHVHMSRERTSGISQHLQLSEGCSKILHMNYMNYCSVRQIPAI